MSASFAEPRDPTCTACGGVPALTRALRPIGGGKRAVRDLWICACGAEVGCHRGGTVAMGRPADRATRQARMRLHGLVDPLWRDAPLDAAYGQSRSRLVDDADGLDAFEHDVRRVARTRVYAHLADSLGLHRDDAHIAMFDFAQCERAYHMLEGLHYADLREIRRRIEARERGRRRREREDAKAESEG